MGIPYYLDMVCQIGNWKPHGVSNLLTIVWVLSSSTIAMYSCCEDFDPTRSQEESVFLPAGSNYTYNSVSFMYRSDRRKKMSFEVSPTIGQFFNGSRVGLEGSLTYRYQPLGFISVDYGINRLKLANPFTPATVWLFGPRIDLTFTKSIFLTTFVQYNSQFDNLNINTRFQWRFQPVSDFFLVLY